MMISPRFIKFLMIGGLGTAIDFALFYGLFHGLGWALIASNLASYGTGLCSSFFFNRAWTFADGRARSTKRIWLALGLGYVGLMLNTLIVWACASVMPAMVAKVIAVPIVLVYNYLSNKHLIFKAP